MEKHNTARIAVVTLAAGKGTRMKSDLPKVLHKVAGRPMVGHALAAAQALGSDTNVVVVGHGAEAVQAYVSGAFAGTKFVVQAEQKGTGHAVLSCKDVLKDFEGTIVVVYGDAPLLTGEALQGLLAEHREASAAVTVLTTMVDDPTGFGRIVRDDEGNLVKSVEEKEADEDERMIDEVNTGIFALESKHLWTLLETVTPTGSKGEYYLTDVLHLAREKGLEVAVSLQDGGLELLGVNDKVQLAEAEWSWQNRARYSHMVNGVGMIDADTVFLSFDTQLAAGVELEPNVYFAEGVTVGEGARIRAFSHLEGCTVGAGCVVGPFARLRPGAALGTDVHIGNFVEVKNAQLADGVKANHLTYLGDVSVGAGTNVGAGTIVANYNHHKKLKRKSVIGANVSIGSGTVLVAPVSVGDNATTGAGTVVRKDVPEGALAVTRGEDVVREGYFNAKKA